MDHINIQNQYRHYNDVIMGAMAYQITSLSIVYSSVYLGAHQRKHQSSASLAFVRGIHRGPVNSPHKWPVTRKMFPFDDVMIVSFHRETQQLSRLITDNPIVYIVSTLHWPHRKLLNIPGAKGWIYIYIYTYIYIYIQSVRVTLVWNDSR